MNQTPSDEAAPGPPLRLRAVDRDDLQVVAACLQDALIPLCEMAFMADDRRFMAAFSRFQWERLADQGDVADLTLCQSALCIDHVDAAQYRGLDQDLDGVEFELLTIMIEANQADGLDITLLFAGDAALRLQVSELAVTLQDFGDAWPADIAPQHDLSNVSSEDS